MKSRTSPKIPVRYDERPRCMSCGAALDTRRRKYCSLQCRQHLQDCLNRRTGLLQALSTRYATFSFSDHLVVMDVLPYDSDQIISYMLPRTQGGKPVDDYRLLSNLLGRAWWREVDRTKKRYKASAMLLTRGVTSDKPAASMIPTGRVSPCVSEACLTALRLTRADLKQQELSNVIKKAYRRQALRLHPDQGGKAETFLRMREAYERLLRWSQHPTFVYRQEGFPDRWLYEGESNRWFQPTARRA